MKINNIFLATGIAWLFVSCSDNNSKSDAFGNFEAVETVISSEANGKLMEFSIEEGQNLEAGKKLGYIDTVQLFLKKEQLMAQKKAVSSRSENIFAQIRVLEEQNKKLQFEKKRIENLLKDGAANQKQLDDIESQIIVNSKQIASIRTQNAPVINEEKVFDVQILQIEDLIKKSVLINPLSGTVLEKYAETFEVVNSGKPLYKIADLSTLQLRVYVSGNQLSKVKIGQLVKVFYDHNDELKETEGKIEWISSNSEFTPKTIQTREERVNLVYAVRILVKNNGEIKIGMPGEIKF
ncbi:MAG: HlyD family efflux transporter periplasmic adaptor subunit [Bacteroidales bacterium]|nr:HlyD family efflux transporter periplasmic adaptor subunit [Bacteroidales bacterium]